MKRLSYIQWYPDDWAGGTQHLSRLQRGAYHDVLMLQFADGGKTTMPKVRTRLGDDYETCWPAIADKFRIDGDRVWNERMLFSVRKSSAFCESRSANRRKGLKTQPHTASHVSDMCNSHVEHMGSGSGLRGGVGEEHPHVSEPTTKQHTSEDLAVPESEPLRSAILGFIDHRKKGLKKPVTPHALGLVLKKVERWFPGDEARQGEVIDYSVEHGWQGVFWPRDWGPEPNGKMPMHSKQQGNIFALPKDHLNAPAVDQ